MTPHSAGHTGATHSAANSTAPPNPGLDAPPTSLSAHQSIARHFYLIVGWAAALGSTAVLLWPALTPHAQAVAALWLAFSAVALGMSRASWSVNPQAVLALCGLMSVEVMVVAHLQGWDIDGAGLPFLFIPLFAVGVLCRTRDAATLYALTLVGLLSLFVYGPQDALTHTSAHPSIATRLGGLVMGATMSMALGMALGRTLRATLAEREHLFLRYRSLFNQVPVAVLLHRDGRILDANDHAIRLFGFEGRRTLMSTPMSERVAGDHLCAYADRMKALESSPPGACLPELECEVIDSKGRRLPVKTLCVRWGADSPPSVLSILTDVRQERAMADALRRARDDAQAANQAKSRFLATTSHEIRTPLNGIIGLLAMARDPRVEEATRQRYLGMMAEAAESLRGLLNDVLDLSKVEAGRLEIHPAPLNLHSLLQGLVESNRVLAEARGLDFVFHGELDPHLTVVGDGQRIRQVLVNLLSNALKFTKQGMVRLSVTRHADGRTLFEVEDTGPGMSRQTQQRLFEPFTQAQEDANRTYGGTGLGLSICLRLVELMNGRIGAVSHLGRGSRFWVELPLPAEAGRVDQAGIPVESTTPAHTVEDQGETATGDAVDSTESLQGTHSRLIGRRMLVVDDNQVNLLITGYILERHGAQVITATSGERALAAARQALLTGRPFDLVFMDVQMPGMDGCEAVRLLRAMSPPHLGPVLALTAGTSPEEVDAARESGMLAVLSKPLNEVDLLRAAAEHLQDEPA